LIYGLWILTCVILPTPARAGQQTYAFTTDNGTTLLLPYDTIQSIIPIDLGGDGTSELLLGSPPGFVGMVYLIRLDGSIINSWKAYDDGFTGGVNVAAGDLDGDGTPEIITAPAGGGGPHVRIFDGYGKPKISLGFFVGDQSYRGDVAIAVQRMDATGPLVITAITTTNSAKTFSAFSAHGKEIKSYAFADTQNESSIEQVSLTIQKNQQNKTLNIPKITKSIERDGKAIIIDTSDQSLSYYENGYRLATFKTSTGKPGYATPLGEYPINNKSKLAYSKTYGLYMPYWMSFIGGLYGIHELPYWPNGYREGEDHLGIAVSHGCVRLGFGSAQTLFEWAEVGTPVIIQQ